MSKKTEVDTWNKPIIKLLAWMPKSGYLKCSIAVGAVVSSLLLNLLLKWLVNPELGGFTAPFVTLSFAVMIAAWYGGFGLGMFANLLVTLGVDYFFLPPIYSLSLSQNTDLINLMLFVLEGTLMSKICQWLRDAQRRAEQQEAREHFLAEASKTLVSTLEYESMLQNVARLVVPFLADWCVVYIQQEDGQVQRLSLVHFDPAKEALGQKIFERYPFEEDTLHPVMTVLRTGQSIIFNKIPDKISFRLATEPEALTKLQELGFKSAMSVPLLARGQVLGVNNLVFSESGRLYNEAELALAEELAHRAALAIDNARLYHKAQLAIEAQKELDQLKDNFLSVAGHELRTPLTTIKGFAQLLKRRLATATNTNKGAIPDVILDSRLLDSIDQQVDRMNKLIEEMLNVTRIQSGQLELELTPDVNLVELVCRVVEQHQIALPKQSILLEVSPPLVMANCDEARLEQVLNNLINNAVKYSPPNQPIVVGLEIRPTTLERNSSTMPSEVLIWVRDDGYGISEEDQPHVFERFYRVRNHKKVKGLGLGLYICYEIIARHNGRMWVTSELGKGSTFYFSLPLA